MQGMMYPSLIRQAKAALKNRHHIRCAEICQQILKLRKDDPEALIMLAQIEWIEGRQDAAIAQMQKFTRLNQKEIGGRLGLALFLNQRGRYREAIRQYEHVLKSAPQHPEAIAGIAYAHEHNGDSDKALEVLQPFLDQRAETAAMALVCATVLRQRGEYEQAVVIARRHVEDVTEDASSRRGLYFVMGLSLERLGDYAEAFEAYQMANAIDPPSFDPDEFDREVDEVIGVFSAKNLAKIPRSTNTSDKPVFISCRPRSGSTLIERILGSHPQIHAAGEVNTLVEIRELLPTFSVTGGWDSRHLGARGIMASAQESPSYLKGLDRLKLVADVEATLRASSDRVELYPRSVLGLDQRSVDQLAAIHHRELKKHSASARRVTNKHLQNWLYLGLVDVLFPGSRIIDVRRNAIDNCLACYTIGLGPNFPYSYNLEHLARVHRGYERLMDHWHSALRVPILSVNYEDIVADSEFWSRRMIDFCGLDWHENCLRFHEVGTKKGSDTPTLSYDQVRQPIYKSSVGRAERFAGHIGPLRDALRRPH